MNLNDTYLYKVIFFKLKYYYTPAKDQYLRDVMVNYTKDGATPNLGIQEVFLLTHEDYNKVVLLERDNLFNRDEVRKLSSHFFSNKGYRRLK